MGPIYEEIRKSLFTFPNGAGPNTAVIFCGNKEKMAFCRQGILS